MAILSILFKKKSHANRCHKMVFIKTIPNFIYRRKKRAVQKKIAMMQERYETEKTLLQREMEDMNVLLEEKQSLLENKDDLLERKKKELDVEIGKREQSIAELQQRVAEYERDMNIKDIAVLVGCRFPEVSLTRSRLLKKIYGIDGKASDFDKRIMLMY